MRLRSPGGRNAYFVLQRNPSNEGLILNNDKKLVLALMAYKHFLY